MKKFFFNEYVYSIATKFVSIAMSMVYSVFIARFLGAELKGQMTYITSICSIGSIIMSFGLHQAYPYLRKKYGATYVFNRYVTLVLVLYSSLLLFFLGLSIIPYISIEWKMSLILIPILCYADISGYICLIESPNERNKRSLISSLFNMLFALVLYLFVEATSAFVFCVIAFVYVVQSILFTNQLHFKFLVDKGSRDILKEVLVIGFFPMMALLMTTLNYKIDILMLKSYTFIPLSQIGVYSIGIGVAEKSILIPDTLKGVLVSKLARGADNNEVAKVCRLCFVSSCLFGILIVLFGHIFINLLYGREYEGAYGVVSISAIGALFIGYFKLISQYNIINKKQKYNVLMLLCSILVNVIGNILLVPRYGINGAAISTCVGHIICGGVFIAYFSHCTSIPIYEMVLLKKDDFINLKKLMFREKNV